MNNVVTVTIPHQLSRQEVRRRISEELNQAGQMLGPMVGPIRQDWTGDTLDFSVMITGQTVSGRAFVEDRQVRLEVTLPWFFAALAGVVRQQIERRGQDLLGHRPISS